MENQKVKRSIRFGQPRVRGGFRNANVDIPRPSRPTRPWRLASPPSSWRTSARLKPRLSLARGNLANNELDPRNEENSQNKNWGSIRSLFVSGKMRTHPYSSISAHFWDVLVPSFLTLPPQLNRMLPWSARATLKRSDQACTHIIAPLPRRTSFQRQLLQERILI